MTRERRKMTVDPGQVLKDARNAVRRGDYAEALEKYLWFYHHALEHDESFSGVRLSYAIYEWIELGEVYPPAREALESIQSSNLRLLQDGSRNPSLFHDFASINKGLGRDELTSGVFAGLAESDPKFARRCFPFALAAVMSTGNLALARRFVRSPTQQLDTSLARLAALINKGVDSAQNEILIGLYAKHVRQISSIFEGVGEREEAALLQMKATEALTDSSLREELRRQLLQR
jgi:tetratricopeptide (TPR) repeat protein